MTKYSKIDEKLWAANITPSNYPDSKQYQDHIMEQYKLYVDSAQKISAQRGTANSFFLTLHTLLLGTIVLILQEKFAPEPRWLILLPLIAAFSLCWAWLRLILSYKQLNDGKFAIIEEFEKKLPSAPFVSAEWSILGKGNDPDLYLPFTSVEKAIPWIFGFLYLIAGISFMLSLLVLNQGGA